MSNLIMGKKTINRETFRILNSDYQEEIVKFLKEKELIQLKPPICSNKKCKFYGVKQMSLTPRILISIIR